MAMIYYADGVVAERNKGVSEKVLEARVRKAAHDEDVEPSRAASHLDEMMQAIRYVYGHKLQRFSKDTANEEMTKCLRDAY